MPGTDSPEEHVLSFIAAYHAAWQRAGGRLAAPNEENGVTDFTERIEILLGRLGRWNESISQVHEAHFVPGEPCRYAGSYGSRPDHDPALETIRHSRQDGATAVVETKNDAQFGPPYCVYQLRQIQGEWRIANFQTHYQDEGETAFTEAEIREILSQVRPDAPLPDLPRGDDPHCHRLFEAGRTVVVHNQPETIQVHRRGLIRLTSGCLGAYDLGYDIANFVPLDRPIPKGDFVAESSIAGGSMLACRILFDPETPTVRYHPARNLNGSALVGMDTANVTFVDAAAFMALPVRQKDRLQQSTLGQSRPLNSEEVDEMAARWPGRDRESFFRMTTRDGFEWNLHLATGPDEPPDAMYFSTGSDGGFPLYWGVGAKGELISVTLDVLYAAQWKTETIRIPWSRAELGQPVRHPLLEEWGITVTLKHQEREDGEDDYGIHVLNGNPVFSRARLFDRDGHLLADSESGGSSHGGDEAFYHLRPDLSLLEDATLEILLTVGYSN